uniref:Uncharacterized protein n=1 Tax=Rangifer tarandus platyrhynchus TaxID=3082113 RepID=A0ACB0EJK3_RANTA|nr:unnamed protein product [Rangifer tarandus platyrhynchus]
MGRGCRAQPAGALAPPSSRCPGVRRQLGSAQGQQELAAPGIGRNLESVTGGLVTAGGSRLDFADARDCMFVPPPPKFTVETYPPSKVTVFRGVPGVAFSSLATGRMAGLAEGLGYLRVSRAPRDTDGDDDNDDDIDKNRIK